MNAVTPLVDSPRRLRLIERPAGAASAGQPDAAATSAREEQRWLGYLVPPFVVGAALFAVAVGTGFSWWLVPGFLLGPLTIIGAFLYLGLSSSSDAN